MDMETGHRHCKVEQLRIQATARESTHGHVADMRVDCSPVGKFMITSIFLPVLFRKVSQGFPIYSKKQRTKGKFVKIANLKAHRISTESGGEFLIRTFVSRLSPTLTAFQRYRSVLLLALSFDLLPVDDGTLTQGSENRNTLALKWLLEQQDKFDFTGLKKLRVGVTSCELLESHQAVADLLLLCADSLEEWSFTPALRGEIPSCIL